MLDSYQLRSHRAEDMPLVMDSWLKSWRRSKYAGVIRNCDYFETTRTLIEDLIARGAYIQIADAGHTILGWSCSEVKDGKTVLHYLYVKDPFLRMGVEDRLLASLPGVAGFFTFHLPYLAKDSRWQHCPEMARRLKL